MTEFIKLPSGDWVNPAHIQMARKVQFAQEPPHVNVWFTADKNDVHYGADAIALAAALDAMSIKEGM